MGELEKNNERKEKSKEREKPKQKNQSVTRERGWEASGRAQPEAVEAEAVTAGQAGWY